MTANNRDEHEYWQQRQHEFEQFLKTHDPDKIEPAPCQAPSADDWQEFKRKFVSEYGGSPVNSNTGMSDREFLDYMATGHREGQVYWDMRRHDFVDKPNDYTIIYR